MKKTWTITPLLIAFALSGFAWAGLYKYQDANGKITIVDAIEKVPEEYRGQIPAEALKPKRDETTERPVETQGLSEAQYKNLAAPEPPAQNAGQGAGIPHEEAPKGFLDAVRQNTASGTVGGIALRAVGAIIILILLYAISSEIFSNLGYKRLGTVITIAVAAFVLIFLVRTQLKSVSEKYKKTAEQVTALQKRLKNKDLAAEKALAEVTNMQTDGTAANQFEKPADINPNEAAKKEDHLFIYK